jgi:hypothetical protein
MPDEPKVCRPCYLSAHCKGRVDTLCQCPCRELNNEPRQLTPSQWEELDKKEASIRDRMQAVEKDWRERERRANS